MLRKLLAFLAAYLALAVDPPAQVDPPASATPDPPPGDEDLENLDLDPDPDDPDARGGGGNDDDPDAVHQRELTAANARAEKAEREAREAREAAAAAERARSAPPPGPSEEQRLFDQEQAILDNPQSTEQQRYWVNANRTLRANERMAREAMFASRDTADRSDFQTLLTTMPLAKKYAKRVEEKVEEFKKQGQLVPRRIALKLLIGDDIVEGKVKTAKKTTTTPANGETREPVRQPVDRGRSPHMRSDVRRGAPSESEKRKARLENQII